MQAFLGVVSESLHKCNGARDPVVIVTAEGFEVGVGGCGIAGAVIINAVFVIVIVVRSVGRGLAALQCGHVTPLVRVEGVALEGDGCVGVGGK
jgi:hypothetical protein